MKLKSILTILDKPGREPVALKAAIDLHELTGAKVDCAAFTWNAVCESEAVFNAQQLRAMRKEVVRARETEARELLGAHGDAGNSVHLETVWARDIADWVVKRMAKTPADLVIKTVNHSKTLLHTPLDWELVRRCREPVLLTANTGLTPSGRVLATLDLRHEDQKHRRLNLRVLNAARYMAGLRGAEVHVVAVTEMSKVLHDLEIIDERALQRRTEKQTRLRLGALLTPYKIPKNHVHQPVGKVGPVVADVARRVKADLVVVGSSAHRLKQALGLGSAAENILQHAPCDVLAIHS